MKPNNRILLFCFILLFACGKSNNELENLGPILINRKNIPLTELFNEYDKVCIQEPYTLEEDLEKESGSDTFSYETISNESKMVFWGLKDSKMEKLYSLGVTSKYNRSPFCYSVNKQNCLIVKTTEDGNYINDFYIGTCKKWVNITTTLQRTANYTGADCKRNEEHKAYSVWFSTYGYTNEQWDKLLLETKNSIDNGFLVQCMSREIKQPDYLNGHFVHSGNKVRAFP